jgi:hypothetical protein
MELYSSCTPFVCKGNSWRRGMNGCDIKFQAAGGKKKV